MPTNSTLTVPYVSLFSGCGGIDLGLEATGCFSAKLCVEYEPAYFGTLKKNQGKTLLGGVPFLNDAKLINDDVFSPATLEELKKITARVAGPWAVVAGPPCQSFSTLGHRRGESDSRGNLTLRFFSLLAEYRPPVFLFENVPPLAQRPGTRLREEIFELLDKAGYHFNARLINMADYGCHTKRKRLIIIGCIDRDLGFPDPVRSQHNHGRHRWRTSAEALVGIPDPYLPNSLTHHEPVYHTEAVKRRFESLAPGQYDRKRHRSKLDPNAPGPTLVAGASGGYCHHIHWTSRELTSRESARLHGFPDAFHFNGSKLDVAKQIANSIPVDFGRAMGEWLFQSLHSEAAVSTS